MTILSVAAAEVEVMEAVAVVEVAATAAVMAEVAVAASVAETDAEVSLIFVNTKQKKNPCYHLKIFCHCSPTNDDSNVIQSVNPMKKT